MTTDPHHEHGEILRRALQAEADTVIPGADGLERIRARIDERSKRRFGRDRFLGFGTGFGVAWGRPVLAVAAAVLIAGIGVTAPQTIELIQSAGSHGPFNDAEPGGADGRGPGAEGIPPGAPVPPAPGATQSGGPAESGSPSPDTSLGSTACATAPAPSATPTPSTTPTPSATPSRVPCPSGSPSPSPSPTPSATGSAEPKPSPPAQSPPSEEPNNTKADQPAS